MYAWRCGTFYFINAAAGFIFAAEKNKIMSQPNLEAPYENRVYYFNIISHDARQVSINMYSTLYIFVKAGDSWENHPNNKNNMVPGLIDSVIHVVQSQQS